MIGGLIIKSGTTPARTRNRFYGTQLVIRQQVLTLGRSRRALKSEDSTFY